MTAHRTLAIIGASLAGAKAAEGARQAGHDGRIVLIGAENVPPYERPPLSKAVLRGDADPVTTRVHRQDFYAIHGIEVWVDTVTGLDADRRSVQLASGESLPFDSAVLATGARPRPLAVPGAGLDGVHYLRTLDDAQRLQRAIRQATRVAVVGAGWIGSEVAASARQMGAEVVLIEPAPTPLHGVLGETLGRVFAQLHADHGVALRLGTRVRQLRGTSTVEEVVLDDGTVEPADIIVAGVGVRPRTELAAIAGLAVDNGVVVDSYLESSVPGIYAAGDIANAWQSRYRRHLRVEHWANALHQGVTAGRNAAGQHDTYGRLPYFFSDQYDLGMEYVGLAGHGDALIVRGDLEGRRFIAFWHRDGIVTAAMNVNVWDVAEDLKAIVASSVAVDLNGLADPDVALTEIAAATARRPPRVS
jgi:3-phenylpropionate/trans-cinnamate dioxygenase ferredoxin reductase subunit